MRRAGESPATRAGAGYPRHQLEGEICLRANIRSASHGAK